MNKESRQWLAKVLGSFGREFVRVIFTLVAIWVFIQYGSRSAKDCDSNLWGLKLSPAEIFSVILVFSSGIGVALLMKLAEWWSKRGK